MMKKLSNVVDKQFSQWSKYGTACDGFTLSGSKSWFIEIPYTGYRDVGLEGYTVGVYQEVRVK